MKSIELTPSHSFPTLTKGQQDTDPKLSFRERQVAELVVRAKLNKEIAHELHLTEGTIKEYLNRIFRKLGVSNRTGLAIWVLSQPVRQEEESAA